MTDPSEPERIAIPPADVPLEDDQRYWPMMSGQPFDRRDVQRREDLFRALIEYGDVT